MDKPKNTLGNNHLDRHCSSQYGAHKPLGTPQTSWFKHNMLKARDCLERGQACATKYCLWQFRPRSYIRFSSTVPFVDICPSPTCPCAETPELEIDRTKPLINTIPPHAKHVVVHTGRVDWAKRIEDDVETPNIARELKVLLGPKGPFYDVSIILE